MPLSPTSAVLLAWLLLATVPNAACAQPCSSGTAACTETVAVGDGPWRAIVYRTRPLTTPNDAITSALVVIHGAQRDAAAAFDASVAAAASAGRAASTLVIAPRFAADGTGCGDARAQDELNWTCDADIGDWRQGSASPSEPSISSFDVVDRVLSALARKDIFPNLRSIVVAGHGAGGQFVAAYQLTNAVHDRLGVPVAYVAANAMAYPYPDDERPRTFNRDGCPSYVDWPFGLVNREGYVARATDEEIRQRAARRPGTYLVGEQDVEQVEGFYGSCKARVQGLSRVDRGLAFGRHMAARYGTAHQAEIVLACGNDERCMLTSPAARRWLFPEP